LIQRTVHLEHRFRGRDRIEDIALRGRAWLTRRMTETNDGGQAEVDIETTVIDVDGDGVADGVSEVTTTVVDLDGDGIADVVERTTVTVLDVDGDGVADVMQRTTTTAYDVDGDGVPDVIESVTVTGVDVHGDGELSDDEISVDETLAVREDLLDDESEGEGGTA
jgi:hypothetical protein